MEYASLPPAERVTGLPQSWNHALCAGAGASPVAYIGHLILVPRKWRRVLRDDGCILQTLASWREAVALKVIPSGGSAVEARHTTTWKHLQGR